MSKFVRLYETIMAPKWKRNYSDEERENFYQSFIEHDWENVWNCDAYSKGTGPYATWIFDLVNRNTGRVEKQFSISDPGAKRTIVSLIEPGYSDSFWTYPIEEIYKISKNLLERLEDLEMGREFRSPMHFYGQSRVGKRKDPNKAEKQFPDIYPDDESSSSPGKKPKDGGDSPKAGETSGYTWKQKGGAGVHTSDDRESMSPDQIAFLDSVVENGGSANRGDKELWTRRPDGKIDVAGEVNLANAEGTFERRIPVNFGVVEKDFIVTDAGVERLDGMPEKVKGKFIWKNCDLLPTKIKELEKKYQDHADIEESQE